MTISTTESRKLYTGNGTTTSFAVPFNFDSESELKVELITSSTNNVIEQVLNTNYTVSGTNVVMTTPPAAGQQVLITLNLDFSQSTNYIANDPFPAETHENALDELSKQIKQLKYQIDYNIPKLPGNVLTTTTATDTNIKASYVFHIGTGGDSVELSGIESLIDINDLTDATIQSGDEIIFADSSDSYNPKKDTVQGIIDLIAAGYQTQDPFLDDIAALTDPGGDNILFWDDSAGEMAFLSIGDNLTITGTTLSASGGGSVTEEEVEDIVGGMVAGNTETGITVTYEGSDGTLDFVVSDLTVAGDTGSTGMTPGDTLTVAGGTGISTSMSGDTLTITASGGSDTFASVEVDGVVQSNAAPTLDFSSADFTLTESPANDFDITLNAERVQDIAGAMFTGNTETLITATYQDADGTIDLVVNEASINHDNLTGFVANEHIDWTSTANNFSTTGTVDTGALGVTGNITVSGTVDGRDIATDGSKLDGIETNADVTDATNVDAAGAVMNSDATTAAMSFVVDEDDMSSDSNTLIPTQQSVKAYVDANAGGGGSGEATELSVSQASHGFSVGDVLRFAGGSYTEAQADSAANAEVVGIVSAVADSGNFTLLMSGYISTLSGLTANTLYYLSDTSAGALTTVEPSDVGDVSKPLLFAISATSGIVMNMRGTEISDISTITTGKVIALGMIV